jgi:hypothetical protein
MKLLTEEIIKTFEKVGRQEESKDPLVIVKFFNPTGAGTWYATEMYYRVLPKEGYEDDINVKDYKPKPGDEISGTIFFGYVSIFGDWCDEWGYFSLSELEEFHGLAGLGIERELYANLPRPISEICPKAVEGFDKIDFEPNPMVF